MNKWKGCIVEESLDDNRVLNNLEVAKVRITSEQDSAKRWHIYNAFLSEREIKIIHSHLKQSWYVHFWKEDKIIVLFKGRKFVLDVKNKETWKDAINYGLSINIPREQLDFLMEF